MDILGEVVIIERVFWVANRGFEDRSLVVGMNMDFERGDFMVEMEMLF